MNKVAPKVCIQIVTWNSQQFLKDCLDSIFNQTYKNFSILVIDNGSKDETIKFIKENYFPKHGSMEIYKEFRQNKPDLFIIQNKKNVGFSKAHNQGLAISQADFVLVMNPDVILEPDFLEKLIEAAEKDDKISSLGGKILKLKWGDAEIGEKLKTNILDSTGLKILRSGQVIDRGEGETDNGQHDNQEEVFGISGACVLYRRAALEDIKIPVIRNSYIGNKFVIRSRAIRQPAESDEYFDEDFFAYKEDIDLAWRLQLFGWQSVYVPTAKAYHFRSGAPASLRFSQSRWVNFLSFRNHLWLFVKNMHWQIFWRNFWFILWHQSLKKLYLLFTQPGILLKGKLSFLQKFSKMLAKRKYILSQSKLNWRVINKWMDN